MNEILYLLITSISSFVALFIIAKLLGKRQIAQLEFADYVIGISIGSIAAEMAMDINEKPTYYYLIAIAIYAFLDLIINYFGKKSPGLKHFLKGKPLTIIYEGKINYQNVKKSKMSINDILSLAREQGYFDLEDIAYAVLENSGHLSIMPKGTKRPTIAEDLNIKIEPASLPFYIICDGRISYSSLSELNKDEKWLDIKLNLSKDKTINDILLAIYDSTTDEITIHYKDE